MNEFRYILTDCKQAPYTSTDSPLGPDYLNSLEGLSKLELKPGEVDGLLFIIGAGGGIYTVYPASTKSGFSSISSPGARSPPILNTDGAVTKIKRDIESGKKHYPGDPRAIVFFEYEEAFLNVAKDLGYAPKKTLDEYF